LDCKVIIRLLCALNFASSAILLHAMLVEFTKMNGAGNDFVLVDNRAQKLKFGREQVVRICDRHRGIGADGLIALIPSASGKADWAWEFYNSDGSTGEMCGNGARCFARYVRRKTGIERDFTFETEAGIIAAAFRKDLVTVSLTSPVGLSLNQKVPLREGPALMHSINTGVPHAVIFVPDADQAMVLQIGPEVRRHPHFAPKGTNVNFVQVLGPNHIRVRTFERGVEGETLACGTGVTASALISAKVHGFGSPVRVQVQGGDQLEVSFVEAGGEFQKVRLTGPADFAFDGTIDL
jgi:diaminopimelate epimerase